MRHSNKRQKIYKKRPEDQRDCYLVLFEFGSLSEGSMWAGLPAVCSGMAESLQYKQQEKLRIKATHYVALPPFVRGPGAATGTGPIPGAGTGAGAGAGSRTGASSSTVATTSAPRSAYFSIFNRGAGADAGAGAATGTGTGTGPVAGPVAGAASGVHHLNSMNVRQIPSLMPWLLPNGLALVGPHS